MSDLTTALDSFQAESALPKPTPSPVAAPETPPISLAEVQATGTLLEWDEALAVAQALCQAFLMAQLKRELVSKPDGSIDHAALTLGDVFIDAAGRISVAGHHPRSVATAIECVGMVASQLLPREDPLSLRARIVARATAFPPFYNSLEELSRALAAYERSSWSELIRAIYERAKDRRPATPAPSPAYTLAATPGVRPKPADSQSRRSEYVWFASAAAAVLVLVVGGVWLLAGRRSAPARSAEKSVSSATDSASADTSADKGSPASRATKPPAVSALAGKNGKGGPLPAGRKDARADQSSRLARARSGAPSRDSVGNLDAPSVPAPAEPSTDLTPIGRAPDRSVVNRMYDAADRDVVPPVVIEPQILGVLSPTSPGVRRESVTIAVIVNERGTVDSVRAVNEPRSIGESVILAAALSSIKSWRFHPAMKEGAPVKYRQIIPLEAVRRAVPQTAPNAVPAAQASPAGEPEPSGR